jgi:acyl carrier protein phosphodiesterase
MYLSGDDDQLMIGNFMGDFVKGRLVGRFPPRIEQGIALHRRIDSYASRSDLFQQSRRRLDPSYGLYRGVLVDLFYDHFLAATWSDWSTEPLAAYLARTEGVISANSELLPERLQSLVPYIFAELLPSYAEVSGIGRALARMARRVRRDNPLAGGEAELLRHYGDLQTDFNAFLPLIRDTIIHAGLVKQATQMP